MSSLREKAHSLGSTATTPAGAIRFLRRRLADLDLGPLPQRGRPIIAETGGPTAHYPHLRDHLTALLRGTGPVPGPAWRGAQALAMYTRLREERRAAQMAGVLGLIGPEPFARLREAARAWGSVYCRSRATTPAGIERALRARWSTDYALAIDYLADCRVHAEREMGAEDDRRERYASRREEIAGTPAYARLARFGALLSAAERKRLQAASGTRLTEEAACAALARLAFARADWGRLRKCYSGKNGEPRIRTRTNGKTGWNCVSWHYADYLAILAPDGRQIYVVYPDQSAARYPRNPHTGSSLIEGALIAPVRASRPERRRAIRRVMRAHARPGWDVAPLPKWPRNWEPAWIERETGEHYHLEIPSDPRPSEAWIRLAQEANTAFRQRATARRLTARNAWLDERLAAAAERIWVGVEDSTDAGNCPVGTAQFAAQLAADLGALGPIGGARADLILRTRDDDYTRRACRVAALRSAPQ